MSSSLFHVVSNRTTSWILAITLFAVVSNPALSFGQAKQQTPVFDGTETQWRGFKKVSFRIDDRDAYVVLPKHAAPGNPWIWRARFPDFHVDADLELLRRGFHIARINTDGMLGSPNAMKNWDSFYQNVTSKGLAAKCCLEGVSRGGLFVYAFASRWPERVACIYCDTPVCTIRSWPGGKGTGKGHDATWKRCLLEYGLTEETAQSFDQNPIDRLQSIADEEIPILHIVSLNDTIVPPAENTFVLAERYRKLGGKIDVIQVEKGTEKSSGHHFTHPDPMRVADFIELHATVLPVKAADYFVLRSADSKRGPLDNCRIKFEREKKGRVAFLGGSITKMNGWREHVCEYLKDKFPETEFDFVDAGIPSTGSTPGAFRLLRDAFANGNVDLLFEEAAVNDLHNMRSKKEMIRGMEGIIRQARTKNPNLDIVVMHFADKPHLNDYQQDKTPDVIANHERVTSHYNVSTIHLAKEVAERISGEQFDWKNDFRNCHPSPFGHRLYVSTIRRMFAAAWDQPLADEAKVQAHSQPDPIDAFSYDRAKLLELDAPTKLTGFNVVANCDPRAKEVGGSVRPGFHNVPMLVAKKPGSELEIEFNGRAIGMFVAAGPDAGIVEYSIDGGAWRERDLFTKWSRGLHIPWAYVLENELSPDSTHKIVVRVSDKKNEKSKGHAVRIVHFLLNE